MNADALHLEKRYCERRKSPKWRWLICRVLNVSLKTQALALEMLKS